MHKEPFERLAVLETKGEQTDITLQSHATLLTELSTKINTLVGEVKQIRNALWFMGAAISANVPMLQKLPEMLSKIFGLH